MPIIKARSSSLISSIDLRGAPTVATAASGVSTTQIASTAFVRNAVAELINSAPEALDTLAELAAALGSDANFASTVTTALAGKLALDGGTMTGFLTLNADPTTALHAVTKQYVDTAIAGVSFDSLGTTDNLDEGLTNLYFTAVRARNSITLDSDNTDVLSYSQTSGEFSFNWPTTDGMAEGVNNEYYTDAKVHGAISLNSDDQSILSYTSITVDAENGPFAGQFTFVTPHTDKIDELLDENGDSIATNKWFTTARARASISAGSNISYNNETGVISTTANVSSVNGQTGTVSLTTDNVSDVGATNKYFTDAQARSAISLTTSDSDVLSYNTGTGVITFVKPNSDGIAEGATNKYYTDARVRLAISVTGDLTYNNGTGVLGFDLGNHSTNDLAEGNSETGPNNLYFTDARARSAITLTTDDASILTYNAGAFTFVTPTTTKIAEGSNKYFTDARARDAISVSEGSWKLTYNSGTGVLTMATPTTSDVEEGTRLYYTDTRARTAVSLTSSNTNVLSYNDTTGVFTFNLAAQTSNDVAEGANNLYYTDERVDDRVSNLLVAGSGITLSYDDPAGTLTVATYANTTTLPEGTNLYFTDARARLAVSAVDNGGDGSFSYNSATGAFTYTGPSASEVRAHLSGDAAKGVNYDSATGLISLASVPNTVLTNSSITINSYVTALGGSVTLDTGDLAEDGNLFFTNARARTAISLTTDDANILSYDDLNGEFAFVTPNTDQIDELLDENENSIATNKWFTDARARAAVSAVDNGGDGSFSYNSTTGAFTYTGPSAAEARAHFSATTSTGVTLTDGVIALASIPNSSLTNSSVTVNGTEIALGGSATFTTTNIGEGTNLYYTDARVQTKLGNVTGHILPGTDVIYDIGSATNRFRDIYLSGSTVYLGDAQLSVVGGELIIARTVDAVTTQLPISLAANTTADLAEDSNATVSSGTMYFTQARARASFSAGTGVTITDGSVAIGQAVGTSDNVTFGNVTVGGDLIVNGSTTTVNSTELAVTDKNITIADGATNAGAANGAGITVDLGADGFATITYDAGDDTWNFNKTVVGTFDGTFSGTFTGGVTGQADTVESLANHDTNSLAEGTDNSFGETTPGAGDGTNNLYFTTARARNSISTTGWQISYNSTDGIITMATPDTSDVAEDPSATVTSGTMYFTNARARAAVSATDAGGDGSFSYDSATGAFTYTGPSAAEARAHFSATSSTGVTLTDGVIALANIPNSSLTNSSVTINGYSTALGGSTTLATNDISEGTDNSIGESEPGAGDGTNNLFFTQSRARSSISADGWKISYNSSTGVITMATPTTSDVAEGTNQYFTTARAQAAISVSDTGGDGSLTYADGVITYTGPSAAEARAHFSATTSTGVTLTDGVIALASIPNSSLTNSSVTVNGTEIALGGSATFTTTNIGEGANLYYTNSRARTAVSLTSSNTSVMSYDNTTGVFTFNLAAQTSNDVAEGANNLYFTNERVDDRVAALLVAGSNITLTYDDEAGTMTVAGPTTTSEITEGTRLYYTDARARGAISLTTNDAGVMSYNSSTGAFTFDSTGLNTDEISQGSTNLYFSNTLARGAISVSGDLTYNGGTGVIGFALSNHSTNDLPEGTDNSIGESEPGAGDGTNNLFFTQARARNAVSLTTDNTDAMSYNAGTGVFTFSLATVNTDEIAEGPTKLYFTTARARASISAGANISYDSSTGVISSTSAVDSVNGHTGVVVLNTDDVDETVGATNLYFTDARARNAITVSSNDTNVLSYNSGTGTLTFVKPTTDGIAEGDDNLYYTNARADARIAVASVFDLSDVDSGAMTDGYTLVWSTTTNSFVPQNIAVTAMTLNFTGDGSTTSFNTEVEISSIENTTVFINGLVQVPTYSYTLSTNSETGETSIVFDTAPESNDYIMVRVESTTQLTAGGILNENSIVDGGIF